MFLDFEVIRRSLEELQSFHPFFGVTFLVCKESRLPVGHAVSFEINSAEKEFLDRYYRLDNSSAHYFQPFRTSARDGRWLSPKYASSGSQSTRTRGDLKEAFYHEKNTKFWGWKESYVRVLRQKLTTDKSGRIPVFWLAVWLYRNEDFGSSPSAEDLIEKFLAHFDISSEEKDELFRVSAPELEGTLWSDLPYRDSFLSRVVEPAPDSNTEDTGSLQNLEIRGTGPADIIFDPAERLSLITGDNGLGKTFILDCSWWALTGTWPTGIPALPRLLQSRRDSAQISFEISSDKFATKRQTVQFDETSNSWPILPKRRTIPGLTIYARVDGSFSVWDPLRHVTPFQSGITSPAHLLFDRDQIMNGDVVRQIEGLIRDWVTWQREPFSETFSLFKRVLNQLSPPDMAPLEPGPPVRLAGDSRLIPTVRHAYDIVPIVHESAGVRRIIALAYLIVWAWSEHKLAAQFSNREPGRKLVVMIDEVESHLHPKWQRSILPALLDVLTYLSDDLDIQVIAATHSPLILASCESVFSEDADALFHLSLNGPEVIFRETPFIKYGTVDAWLTSDIFALRQARSKPAENVVERARLFMGQRNPDRDSIIEISNELRLVLPADDELWVRWLFYAKQKDVEL